MLLTGEIKTDGTDNLQVVSENEIERVPSNDEAQVGNLSGRQASRRAPKPGLCNYIMALAFAILTLGGFGGSAGLFFLYRSTRRFKEWPSDQDSLLDFHTGAVILGVTFIFVLAFSFTCTLTACTSVIQESRKRRIALQGIRDSL
ncbi:hypothetical protein [Criblamydia sequanensis]|uniref:Membrane protein n=1 Tax=Candidatus Criblamydia sequanensis CRIB-18 TaxID=1437425 RepID=A0A090CZH1_9BACT|nr:hypothetical protein [Criblamydia sequanensis]CDR34286.1 putative membrane protein [Criblamydia sequanensis CRIB-18]